MCRCMPWPLACRHTHANLEEQAQHARCRLMHGRSVQYIGPHAHLHALSCTLQVVTATAERARTAPQQCGGCMKHMPQPWCRGTSALAAATCDHHPRTKWGRVVHQALRACALSALLVLVCPSSGLVAIPGTPWPHHRRLSDEAMKAILASAATLGGPTSSRMGITPATAEALDKGGLFPWPEIDPAANTDMPRAEVDQMFIQMRKHEEKRHKAAKKKGAKGEVVPVPARCECNLPGQHADSSACIHAARVHIPALAVHIGAHAAEHICLGSRCACQHNTSPPRCPWHLQQPMCTPTKRCTGT